MRLVNGKVKSTRSYLAGFSVFYGSIKKFNQLALKQKQKKNSLQHKKKKKKKNLKIFLSSIKTKIAIKFPIFFFFFLPKIGLALEGLRERVCPRTNNSP